MQETLFDRLFRPESTAVLGLQYRMNSSICELANKVTYKGALKCGSQEVADSKFILPNTQVRIVIQIRGSKKGVQGGD